MLEGDDQNLDFAGSIDAVDKLNARFYKKFPYPWPPLKFDSILDPYFETVMVNQALGDWENKIVPRNPRIWVAGCGTNLAVFTALKFPQASITGSDLSAKSLEVCANTARQLKISNLELKEESINHVTYEGEFDYIVCTGVIHHNANPKATLDQLVTALKPTGILELMVYNRYHFMAPTATQKAIRILSGNTSVIDMELELSIARKLVNNFPVENSVATFLAQFKDDAPDAMLADLATQPVVYSYTVESLEELATQCGLELLAPCLNLFDKSRERIHWNMDFNDPQLRGHYDSLPDTRRWQVSNLLLLEKSPMLWFYLQRKDCGRARKSEHQICAEFLETKFVRTQTQQRNYLLRADGSYKLLPHAVSFPIAAPDLSVRTILDSIDGESSIADILKRVGVEPTFQLVNQARLKLTTPAFPYLRASQSIEDENGARPEAPPNQFRAVGTEVGSKRRMMEKKEREESNLKRFKSIKAKPIILAEKKLIKMGYLQPGDTLPLVVQPEIEDVDLAGWAQNNLEFIDTNLSKHGAILFRGFAVRDAAHFERFAFAIRADLFNENGEHPREVVSGNVYTPVFYPPDKRLLWHNENSFNYRWPAKIWFCCLKPARQGGETPIVDSRKVYDLIDPGIRERFERKKVMYVRNHWEGLGLSWQALFRTTDKSVVEDYCRKASVEFEWKAGDGLITRQVRPAAVKHPKTGEMSWFNQIQHWHIACLEPAVRESMMSEFSEEDLPRHAYYGDGSSIEDSVMDEILEVYRKLEVKFPWQPSDILMLDNILTAHGRNPFVGERKLLVSMAEMLSYAEV